MTASPSQWARVTTLFAAVCAIVGLGVTTPGLPAHATTTASSSTPGSTTASTAGSGSDAANRVKITLDSLEPKVVKPADTVTVDGVLLNTSGVSLTNVSVVLRTSSQRVGTRYDLDHDSDPNTITGAVLLSTQQILGDLAPGGSVSWHISVPVRNLGLPDDSADFGVYPIEIEAGTTATNGGRLRTRLPTFLTWMPTNAQFAQTDISWLWPLIDGIHRSIGTTFSNDALAKDLAPTGRVGSLLSIATTAPVPITYALDPALVDDAVVMAASVVAPKAQPGTYRVANGTRTTAGTGADVAAAFLTKLRASAEDPHSAVIGVPYGDADIVALDRAGLDREIDIARSTGLSTLDSEIDARVLSGVVWPVGGVIDESTLSDLAGDLVGTVVLGDTALPPRDPNLIPGIRADLQTASGPVGAVLTDSDIDSLVANPTTVPGGLRAAEQLFLAQTMLITEQRPGAGSSVVIAPPRTWNPNPAFARDLLADSGSVPWLRGVDLSAITSQPADGVARSPLVYPGAARAAELPTSGLAEIGGLRQGLDSFGSILGSSTTEPFLTTASTSLLRAESAELRDQPAFAANIRGAAKTDLRTLTSKVSISNPRLITLTSGKDKIPVTVVNNLPDPITVALQLGATNTARLKVEPVPSFTVDGNGTRHTALITVEPRTNGRFEVSAQLMTPETTPRLFGEPITFEMNSTVYGTGAIAIAGGAAGLLFLLSAIRLIRRFRRRANPPKQATAAAETAS